MSFWFSEEQQKSGDISVLTKLANAHECLVCPLTKIEQVNPNILPSGSDKPLIYIIGEAPGFEEDQQGKQFVGKSGIILRKELKNIFGRQYEEIIRFSNTIRCWPGKGNPTPNDLELACCKNSLITDIEKTKPKVIIGTGNIPLKQLLGIAGITLNRGRKFPIKVGNHICWYFPILHPSYILRKKSKYGENEYDKVFRQDIQSVKDFLESENYFDPVYIEKGYDDNIVCFIYDNTFTSFNSIYSGNSLGELKEILNTFAELPLVSLDIETTALKPYNGGKFLSVAISNHETTFAFNLNETTIPLFKDFLYNSGTKICHALKFELEWFAYYFGDDIVYNTNWEDTYALAYTLDERKGGLSLDYLCLLNFGFNLKELSNVDRRKLTELWGKDPKKVLLYNGLDVKYTYLLHDKLKKQLPNELIDTYNTLVNTGKMLTLTQKKGLVFSTEKMKEFDIDLTNQINVIVQKIKSREEVKRFEKWFGTFNHNSPAQVSKLLTEILHIKLDKKTDSYMETEEYEEEYHEDKYSTDKSVLTDLANKGIEICKLVLEYRELNTLMTKYVKPIPSLIDSDGLLRTQFNHCFTTTGRLSSQNPNLQNLPKRKNKHIRNVIVTKKGYKFVAFDLAQAEYRLIAIASKDKKMCDAIIKGYDPHREWALELLRLYPEYAKVKNVKEVEEDKVKLKKVRDEIKNLFVFPVIYGASFHSVSKYLNIPLEIAEELYNKFFKVHYGIKEHQKKIMEAYNKFGYVENLFGRRRRSPISKNKIYNTGAQADASDIVVRAMNRLSLFAIKTKQDKFQPILNIHDDISFYLPEENIKEDIEFIAKEICNPCFDFINVPIGVEVSVGDSWGNLIKYKEFDTRSFDYCSIIRYEIL